VNGGQRVVLGSWLTIIVLAIVRKASDPSQGGGLPPPSTFIGSGVLMSLFYGGAGFAPGLFGTLAVGVIVAAALKPYADARGVIPQSGPLYSLGKLIDQASGTITPQPTTTQGASA
jgi:hypothetical protein